MVIRRVLMVMALTLGLAACQFDVEVAVNMEPDGTGVVTVVAQADAELTAEVPDLIESLRLEDATANGWTVEGPRPLDAGGTEITLSHPFGSADELANVLNSVGPPLSQVAASRLPDGDLMANSLTGQLSLPQGFRSFADDDLIAAVGDVPFSDRFAAVGAQPSDTMSFTLTVDLPGRLVAASTGTQLDDGSIRWTAPLDGSIVEIDLSTVQQPASSGSAWARPVAVLALAALVVWVIAAGAFIAFVMISRRRRQAQRRRRSRRR